MIKKVGGRSKSASVSKAQAIRDEFAAQGIDARPKDIIATLASKGVEVSSAQVSNIKATLGDKSGRKGRGANGALSIEALLETKKFADSIGGVEVARKAIEALVRLS